MKNINELTTECRKLPDSISGAAEAMVRYVSAISGDDWMCDASGRWRPGRENFVTVKPQWKQAGSLAVTLRGNPDEFEQSDSLVLSKDQNGYSVFRLENASQIADAFNYVKRAHIIFDRGRARARTTPLTVG